MTEITQALLDEIEAKAKAATPGPWRKSETKAQLLKGGAVLRGIVAVANGLNIAWATLTLKNGGNDLAHIARCDPSTILALVAAARACMEQTAGLPAPGTLPDFAAPPPAEENGMPVDPTAVFNARVFIEAALAREPRIAVTGAGCWLVKNECDIDIKIDGAPYNLTIRPLPMRAASRGSEKT